MRTNLQTILACFGIAILAILFVNLISFGLEIVQNGFNENWSFRFKHGVFYLGDKPSGLILGSAKANGFMIFVFTLAIIRNYQKGNFSIGR